MATLPPFDTEDDEAGLRIPAWVCHCLGYG
jgi:hypothetical protein